MTGTTDPARVIREALAPGPTRANTALDSVVAERDQLREQVADLIEQRDRLREGHADLTDRLAGYRAALEEIEKRAKREYENYEEHGGIIAMYEPLAWVQDLCRRALNGDPDADR